MDKKLEIIEQLRQVQVVMHRTAFRGHKEHSSYRGRGKVLSVLKETPQISRKELEERLNISRQGLTELLLKLEKSGYILRQPSEYDRREMMVCLTEQGRQAIRENDDGMEPMSRLLECLSEEELANFGSYLNRILEYNRKICPESCSHCTGPETCTHDYLKFGHNRPNPKYCKYAHMFSEQESNGEGGERT